MTQNGHHGGHELDGGSVHDGEDNHAVVGDGWGFVRIVHLLHSRDPERGGGVVEPQKVCRDVHANGVDGGAVLGVLLKQVLDNGLKEASEHRGEAASVGDL